MFGLFRKKTDDFDGGQIDDVDLESIDVFNAGLLID